jgi:hypothetical protein
MNKFARASAIAALAFGAPAMAADFNYNFFDVGLILADTPGSDGKGIGVLGSMDLPQLHDNATAVGGVSFVDFDGGSVLNLEGGLGFHWPIASVVDFTGGLGLNYQRVSNGGGSDLGFTLNAGVRAVPFSPQWELNGGLKYVDIGPFDDTSIVLGTRYTFKPGMSAGIHLTSGDIDYWTLSVRWEL